MQQKHTGRHLKITKNVTVQPENSKHTIMNQPKALIFSGYGLNSEEETAYGFELAGAMTEIVHINDIIDGKKKLANYQILSFPGGFAYGDDTGAGNAYASKVKNHLWETIQNFIQKDKLIIGICNGCQIIMNLGLIPAFYGNYDDREVAVVNNTSARFSNRWVDMKVVSDTPWLKGIDTLSLPIAHGEGNFFTSKENLKHLQNNKQIALQYINGDICTYLNLPTNPNGSIADIAGITDETGRILGLMPHPERGMFFVQRPDWQLIKETNRRTKKQLPTEGPGLQIFKNAVNYFS
ncbi:MAG TPA: phosphoribosylformylglycinamidine synthase subunit PurQ [Candidatus Sulfotelmatobacter sp.]|jgi:phosphoribosylformylglycinamidine synthase I|nr:phosphoribosylformylglycinamidine synthase subunit PurQ [Candidatus Sulfotelmatobacter sp.]